MAKFIRYALATLCFAASVGCLALWWRSLTHYDALHVPSSVLRDRHGVTESMQGNVQVTVLPTQITAQYRASERLGWRFEESTDGELIHELIHSRRYTGSFGVRGYSVYFPHWYPALIFALAGVAALRLGRFTIRSALIVTTVVAGLLGMAVAL